MRASPLHADLTTNSSSRGRIGRSTIGGTGASAAVAAGLGVAMLAGALAALGAEGAPFAVLTGFELFAGAFTDALGGTAGVEVVFVAAGAVAAGANEVGAASAFGAAAAGSIALTAR